MRFTEEQLRTGTVYSWTRESSYHNSYEGLFVIWGQEKTGNVDGFFVDGFFVIVTYMALGAKPCPRTLLTANGIGCGFCQAKDFKNYDPDVGVSINFTDHFYIAEVTKNYPALSYFIKEGFGKEFMF